MIYVITVVDQVFAKGLKSTFRSSQVVEYVDLTEDILRMILQMHPRRAVYNPVFTSVS